MLPCISAFARRDDAFARSRKPPPLALRRSWPAPDARDGDADGDNAPEDCAADMRDAGPPTVCAARMDASASAALRNSAGGAPAEKEKAGAGRRYLTASVGSWAGPGVQMPPSAS